MAKAKADTQDQTKQEQKQAIVEIMQQDQTLGLYDEQPKDIQVEAEVKTEQVQVIPQQVKQTVDNLRNKVQKILQKRPSHYSLLMQDGRQVVVHKSLFDKTNMVVLSDVTN